MRDTICMQTSAIGFSLLALCLSSSLPIQVVQAIIPLNTTPIFSPSPLDT